MFYLPAKMKNIIAILILAVIVNVVNVNCCVWNRDYRYCLKYVDYNDVKVHVGTGTDETLDYKSNRSLY